MRFLIGLALVFSIADLAAQLNQVDSLDRKQGLWVKTQEGTKQIEYRGSFIDGVPVGQFRYYYPTGQVRCIIEHINRDDAYVTFYFTNAEVMSDGFYKNERRDSLWLTYDRDGATLFAEHYKKGKLNGKRVVFYLRDQIEFGSLNVLSETVYREGLKEGSYIALFSSGKLKERGQYHLDEKKGVWKIFNADGYLDHTMVFKAGLKHGWFEFFNADGLLVDRVLYQNDKLLNKDEIIRFMERCEKMGIDPND
tara:strand:- start:417 stop:1169 length:753 start_codon:yes stop_codon:yes gene_type:complete